MPLIICGDCQKKYSDYASACPECGRPTITQKHINNLFPNYYVKKFNSRCLKLISNSKEEIYDFSKEVLDYLGGNWKLDSEDIKFQEKFWKIIYDKSNFKQVTNIPAPIGKSF